MTNEEAIKWLKDIHHRFNPTGEKLENEGGDVHLQALDMAIEALKQVAGKLNNPDDTLLTEHNKDIKEQKSKLDLIKALAKELTYEDVMRSEEYAKGYADGIKETLAELKGNDHEEVLP